MFNLNTAFIAAIRCEDSILQTLGATKRTGETEYKRARLFSTSWPGDDTKEPELPYVVVVSDGMQREGVSKDGDRQYNETIRLIVVQKTEASLDTLCQALEDAIDDHLDDCMGDSDELLQEPELTANPKMYDDSKPCYYRELIYSVSTAKTID